MGKVYFHIPMFVAMLIFIRVPTDDLEKAFPQEGQLANFWYYYALGLHVFLGINDFVLVDLETEGFSNFFNGLQTIGRFANMLNLCLMLHLYGTCEISGQKTD